MAGFVFRIPSVFVQSLMVVQNGYHLFVCSEMVSLQLGHYLLGHQCQHLRAVVAVSIDTLRLYAKIRGHSWNSTQTAAGLAWSCDFQLPSAL